MTVWTHQCDYARYLCLCYLVLCECYTVFHQSNISSSNFVSLLTSDYKLHTPAEWKKRQISILFVLSFVLSLVRLSVVSSFLRSFIRPFVRSSFLSFVLSFVCPCVHLSFRSFGRPFVSSFVLSFVRFAKVQYMSNVANELFDCISILLELHSIWGTNI